MEKFAKLWYLFLLAVIVFGIGGGIGYAAKAHAYVIMSCLIGCGALLAPTVIELWKSLTNTK